MTKRTNKRPGSVVDMVRRVLPDDKEFVSDLEQQTDRRRLVSQLAILRNFKGISQADVAEQCGCNQSRISKLENGFDEDVTVDDLKAYAKLCDCDLTIVFNSKGGTLADRVKYHATCIKECFDELNELVKGDQIIARGFAKLLVESLFSFVKIVKDASTGLRASVKQHAEPRVSLQVQDSRILEDDDAPDILSCSLDRLPLSCRSPEELAEA